VNDRLTFLVDAELYRGENSAKPMIFFYYPTSQLGATNPGELGIDHKLSYSSNDLFQTSKSSNFFVQMNYEISEKWTSQTNFTSTHSYSDGPNPYFFVVPNSVVTGDDNAVGADYLTRAVQSTEAAELGVKEFQQNFIGDFTIGEMRNRLVVGFDLFSQNSNQLFYGADFDVIRKNGSFTEDGSIENYGTFNKTNYNKLLENGYWTWPYEYKTNTYSAYVMDVLNLRDNLILMASLRFDRFDNKGSRNDGSGSFSDPYTQNELSPKFGIVYQPVKDQVALFANYQNGFKNQNGIDARTSKTFTPEHAIQTEGGIKIELFNGKLSSTISYYDIQVRDLVRSYIPTEDDLENPNFPINPQVQDGTQTSNGIEVELIANPFKGLNVVAGFAYNDSELERADEDVVGRRPATAMSPYAANLWVSYHLMQGPLSGLGFGFGGNYASDNKVVNSASMGVFTLPAYTVMNASVFYDHPKFRAGFKADNLTDELYWIGYTTMNVQKLRSFTGSLTLKF
jgi:iron complex outermembrane receptor protein